MKRVSFLTWIFSLALFSSEFQRGKYLLHGSAGELIYFLQDPTTKIQNAALVQVGFEYLLCPQWSIGAALRPLFAADRFGMGLAANAKYRFLNQTSDFVPFVGLGIIPSVLVPTNLYGTVHFDLGVRPSTGFEYGLMPDLAFYVETAVIPNLLFGTGTIRNLEVSFELLAGITWRL